MIIVNINFNLPKKKFVDFFNKEDLFCYFVSYDFHKYFANNFFKDTNLSNLLVFFDDDFLVKEKLIFINNLDIEFEEIEQEFSFLNSKDYELSLLASEDINSSLFKKN